VLCESCHFEGSVEVPSEVLDAETDQPE